jgi:hypothetical protein
MSLRRRPALLLVLAALLLALASAGIHAATTRSAIRPTSDDSVLTGSGSTAFATGGDLLGAEAHSSAGVLLAAHHDSFKVTVGNVAGLYPGKRQRLPVRFSNPLPYPIRIDTATTTAAAPRGCPPDTSLLLRTRTFHHLIIGTNRAQAKTLRFGMLKTATDACQDGTFTVTVSVAAVRA